MIFLGLVSFRDPGIIPAIRHCEGELMPQRDALESMSPPSQIFAFESGTFSLNSKYCKFCRVFRPPRASHCFECQQCVERFDHHCPWIGICVGKKNYFYFILYISFTLALLVCTSATGIWFVVTLSQNLELSETRGKDIAFLVVTVFIVLASVGVS